MKNFVQPGENITVTADAATTSGEGVNIGNLFGIASGAAEIGDPLVLVTTGVFEMSKVAADDIAIGTSIYHRAADGLVTGTAAGNTKIGVATTLAIANAVTVNVRLNGTF